jgi:hypothetical protein
MSDWGDGNNVADPLTGVVRLCDDLCSTCVFRPGNLMNLGPGRVKEMTDSALADEGHIVCHSTLGTEEPAICAGYANLPAAKERSLALRMIAFGLAVVKRIKPPSLKEKRS